MRKGSTLLNRRGSAALLACAMICFLLVGIVHWYFRWSMVQMESVVAQNSAQRALQNAESGVSAVLGALKDPQVFASTNTPPALQSTGIPGGRYAVSYIRDSGNPSLVDAYSTGYFYLMKGPTVDPGTNQRARIAVVHAKIRLDSVNSYFAAVPGSLTVAAGSDLGDGSVYARNLVFEKSGGLQTKIGTAYYTDTVTRSDTGAQDPAPSFVTFNQSPNQAQKLASPPNLTTLDGSVRQHYQTLGTGPAPSFSGPASPPSGGSPKVYYIDGDVEIGAGAPLEVTGAYVIYATGKVTIHNSITMQDPSHPDVNWLGILAEKDIVIAGDSPQNIELAGNFVTNGTLRADSSGGLKNNLTFKGGFLAHQGISLSNVYTGTRSYSYAASHSPDVSLPNFTTVIQYEILKGKYAL